MYRIACCHNIAPNFYKLKKAFKKTFYVYKEYNRQKYKKAMYVKHCSTFVLTLYKKKVKTMAYFCIIFMHIYTYISIERYICDLILSDHPNVHTGDVRWQIDQVLYLMSGR